MDTIQLHQYTTSSTIGVIGTGTVGQVLALAFLKIGNPVMIGSRDVTKPEVQKVKDDNPTIQVGTFAETAKYADIVVLAVGGNYAVDAVKLCGDSLNGKIIIDATNPLKSTPPVDGIIQLFTEQNDSLIQILQRQVPLAHFVKAFNTVGNQLMFQPSFPNVERPVMFICGNNNDAKVSVSAALVHFGWTGYDVGMAAAGGSLESLCVLWCAMAMREKKFANHHVSLLTK
eukprot:gene11903-13869_t